MAPKLPADAILAPLPKMTPFAELRCACLAELVAEAERGFAAWAKDAQTSLAALVLGGAQRERNP